MKIGVLGDTHNNLRSVRAIVEIFDRMRIEHVVHTGDITQAKVPGAFEIPLACQKMAETGKYDGILALGAVIRGGTPHFEYVAGEAVKGIAAAGQRHQRLRPHQPVLHRPVLAPAY